MQALVRSLSIVHARLSSVHNRPVIPHHGVGNRRVCSVPYSDWGWQRERRAVWAVWVGLFFLLFLILPGGAQYIGRPASVMPASACLMGVA